ncbi:MAG: hypothetical protein GY853_09460 [PVC group bacterium]|nr:hypothetical protein [PVC group bacterium]
MSIWYSVKDKEDVAISEDGKSLEILFEKRYDGNHYVEVPVKFIQEVVNEKTNEN